LKYKITHTTAYYYGEPVPLGHNLVHLKPRENQRQSLINFSTVIRPNPIIRTERVDFFGNAVTWFAIQEPHKSLQIVARSLVEVKPFEPPKEFWWPAWDEVVRLLDQRRDPAMLEAQQFISDSPYIDSGPEVAAYAKPSFPPGRPLLDAVSELTHRIHTDFRFDKNATTVGTPVLEVLHHRHGVCQDFAHLQISCLRSLGLAARYVSGYLCTQPPPGCARIVGGDASHAWVSVFFPDFGWIDFDPTNDVIPSAGHITLGWARDYDDISPVRGVVVGGRRHSLQVSVDVEPLTARDQAATKVGAST
jgi:transglutaminase-like putative cysteine protease